MDPGEAEGVAQAMLTLLSEKDAKASRRERFQETAKGLTWEKVAAPLVAFCRRPEMSADKRAGYPPLDSAASQLANAQQKLEVGLKREKELLELVKAYERGRFIRTVARLKRWQRRLLGPRQGS